MLLAVSLGGIVGNIAILVGAGTAMAVVAWTTALMKAMRMPRRSSFSVASSQAEMTVLPWPGPAA